MNLRDIRPEMKWIPIGLLDDPHAPSRSEMDELKLDELAANIATVGLLEPMIVFPTIDRYEIIAGHRRLLGCQRAQLVDAPCMVYPAREEGLYAIQHAENRFREELSPHDEAIWFVELLNGRCGADVDKVCAMVGEKRSYVEGRLDLVLGDSEVFEAIKPGGISIGVAQQLNKITAPEYRHYYLACALREGATVAVATGWVQQWRAMQGPKSDDAPPASVVASAPASSAYDPHRCYVCDKSDPRYLPEQVAIHTHCLRAIVDPLLAGELPVTQK